MYNIHKYDNDRSYEENQIVILNIFAKIYLWTNNLCPLKITLIHVCVLVCLNNFLSNKQQKFCVQC